MIINDIKVRARFKEAFKKVADTVQNREKDSLNRSLKEAQDFGRGLIRQQFKSRRFANRFGFKGIKNRQSGVVAEFGYVKGKRAFLGNFYESGSVTRPKKSAKLWIPIGANRTRKGAAVMSPAEAFAGGFVRETRAGKTVFFRDGDMKPMFVLKEQNRNPRRPVFRPTWAKYETIVADRVAEDIAKPLQSA